MARGRPRKPSNVLTLTGRFRTNPDQAKKRENEPKIEGLLSTTPPEWMTDKAQRKCYRQLVRLAPANVLSLADGILVEVVAGLLAEYRADPLGMKPIKLTRLMNGLGQLGMSPSERSKTIAIKEHRENPFASLVH